MERSWSPPDESRWGEVRSPTTDAERRAYEKDCLAHVRYWIESVSRDHRHDMREAWLEGSHTDTRIMVRWFDLFYENEHVESYPVWSSIFTTSDGGVEVRSQVAMLIHTWVSDAKCGGLSCPMGA